MSATTSPHDAEIRRLYRARPRNRFARWTGVALVALVAYSWLSGDLGAGDLFSERRLANLQRFLGELRPYPLQQGELETGQTALSVTADWAYGILRDKGLAAAQNRLAHVYAEGVGVEKSQVEAAKWRLIARASGLKDETLDALVGELPKEQQAAAQKAAIEWRERAGLF